MGDRCNASPEVARDLIDLQAEEVFDLRAGDKDRDPVREADHDRTRNEPHRSAESCNAHEDENHSGKKRADVEPFNPVTGNDAGHDNHECASRSADLRARAAESRN